MKCSILYTTRNRGHLLDMGLWSILHGSRLPEEIIVVDDGPGGDNTPEVVRRWADQFRDIQISYLVHKREGGWANPAVPRNKGIRMSHPKHEILMFSEPEMLWHPDTLRTLMEWFENPPAHLPIDPREEWRIGAGQLGEPTPERFYLTASFIGYCALNQTPYGDLYQNFDALFGHGTVDRRWPEINTRVAAVRRDDVFALRGWDEAMSGWGYDDSVTGDTPVTIRREGIVDVVPIGDLYPKHHKAAGRSRIPVKGLEILTRSGWSELQMVYRHKVKKPVYKIQTTRGLIKVTGDHSLFQGGEPVKVSDLKVGDEIDTRQPVIYPLHETVTEPAAWLFGLFAAEGSALVGDGHYNWRISNQNKALLERAQRAAEHYFCTPFVIRDLGDKMFGLDPTDHSKGNKKAKAILFREKFYTQDGKKRVPVEILNGTEAVKRAFLEGYFAGDGSFDQVSKHDGYTTNSFTLARGLELLLRAIGVGPILITTREDKPDVILLRPLLTDGARKGGITKIEIDAEFHDYVYDVTTADHTFVAGLGGIIAHNTDFMTRMMTYGVRHIPLHIPVVHLPHENPPAGGPQADMNLRRMQESMNGGIYAVNDRERWGLGPKQPPFGDKISAELWEQIQAEELASWTGKAWPSLEGKLYRERKYLKQAFDDLGLNNIPVNAPEQEVFVDVGCGPLSVLEEWRNPFTLVRCYDPLHEGYTASGLRAAAGADLSRYAYGRGERIEHDDNSVDLITSVNGIDHYEDPRATLKEMYRVLRPGGTIRLHYCVNNASEGHPHPAHRIDLDIPQMVEWGEALGLEKHTVAYTYYGWRHQLAAVVVFRKPLDEPGYMEH